MADQQFPPGGAGAFVKRSVEIADRGRPLGTPLSVWFHFRLVPFLAAHLVKLLLSTLRVSRDGFEAVQELVDRDPAPGRFILTGSQHFGLSDAVRLEKTPEH